MKGPILAALLCLTVINAQAEILPFEVPQIIPAEDFQDFFAEVAPGVYVAGQPSEKALARMAQQGVTTVINLRTHQEMDNRQVVPFDESAAIAELGMQYVHIPQGGPQTPYSPAALSRFAEALHASEGKVLLHCTVAWRASHLWAAYLVAYHNVPVPKAVELGKQMNMGGYPFAEFLARDIDLNPATDNGDAP